MIVIADTSPVANLLIIRKLEILEALFTTVTIPPKVYKKILALKQFKIHLSLNVLPG